jgi:transposase
MSIKYDAETKARAAVRLVTEHAGDYHAEWAAMTAISRRLGMTPETLRCWVRQAQVDAGQRSGVSTESAREIRELKRAELSSTLPGG